MSASPTLSSSGTGVPPVVRILWSALLMSVAIYAGIGVFLHNSGSIEAGPFEPVFLVVFGALAASQSMFVLAFARRVMAAGGDYKVFCIFRWALSEAVGIYGLVIILLGGPLAAGLAFIGWAILLMLILFPSEGDYRRFRGVNAGIPGMPSAPDGPPPPIEP